LKNHEKSSDLPGEQTISIEDIFEAHMRVIDKVRGLNCFERTVDVVLIAYVFHLMINR
jgi:hypothetical protein